MFLFGIFLSMRGIYFFIRGALLVMKCLFYLLFASEETVDSAFDNLLENEYEDYRSFEKELKEMTRP